MILLNFSHPLTSIHLERLQAITGDAISEVRNFRVQFDPERSYVQQVQSLLDEVGISAQDWQTQPILINPPAYNLIAMALLAELHGRMGYFPAVIRLKPVPKATPPRYEIGEVINLQEVRDQARTRR